jgi:hypothetical protein
MKKLGLILMILALCGCATLSEIDHKNLEDEVERQREINPENYH